MATCNKELEKPGLLPLNHTLLQVAAFEVEDFYSDTLP